MFLNEIPTGWGVGNPPLPSAFSVFGFKEWKNYHQMLKNKGQPYNENEINELQASILHKLRRFIFDFYGDGSTRENEGFKIVADGSANDFTIKGGIDAHPTGDTLRNAGRIFMDGYQIVFYNQLDPGDTFDEKVGDRLFSDLVSISRATPGVLTTPGAPRVDEVYLEFTLDEITAAEDPDLQNPEIDADTIRMAAKDWSVIVAEGGTTPENSYDGGAKLWTYRVKLAELHRTAQAEIDADMVIDFRLNRWWKEHGPNGEHIFNIPGFAFTFIQNIFRGIAAGVEGNFTSRYEYLSTGVANGIEDLARWVMTDDGVVAVNFKGEGDYTYLPSGDLDKATSYFADTYGLESANAAKSVDQYTYDGFGNLIKAQRTVTLENRTFFQPPFDF